MIQIVIFNSFDIYVHSTTLSLSFFSISHCLFLFFPFISLSLSLSLPPSPPPPPLSLSLCFSLLLLFLTSLNLGIFHIILFMSSSMTIYITDSFSACFTISYFSLSFLDFLSFFLSFALPFFFASLPAL